MPFEIPHFINGEHRPPHSGRYLDNIEPAAGQVFSRVAAGDSRDIEAAAQAAQAAFPAWSRTTAGERADILNRIAALLEQRLEEFAQAECQDSGKPITTARTVDIPRAVLNFRFFASAIQQFSSEFHDTSELTFNFTLRQPRGIAGCISPWNLPLYLFTWKIAPALAAGNTVVAKPSELTPLTAHMLTSLCNEAGLPPGVLNVVHGLGGEAGAALTAHPAITTITFTGSTATGAAIARTAAPLFKKIALEMGGKNPVLVFADADLDSAIQTSVRGAFSNTGQICLCGSRIFVERSIYQQFIERFVDQTRALKIGDPADPATQLGALASQGHWHKVLGYVELAQQEGGTLLTGGMRPANLPPRCNGGYFLAPTVITGLAPDCRTNREEIFGPVVSIQPFDTGDEAIRYANLTDYGLAASIWTQNLNRMQRLARAVQAGTLWFNCWMLRDLRVPFGGMKESGVGREGGLEALRFFTEPKNVCIHGG
ncbi:MAG: 2-aminomuconic 6-semialdehyde dehydrogenase [Myxococcota bacterium]|nr:2-aminomuconic 6-semialdehyde dehydrogenase [Myxococcota bacterium]